MPRAAKLDTGTIKKLLAGVAKEVKEGSLDPKKANCMISAFKAILYGNQLENTERRLAVDEAIAEYQKQMIEYMEGKRPLPPMNDFNEEAILNEDEEPESP